MRTTKHSRHTPGAADPPQAASTTPDDAPGGAGLLPWIFLAGLAAYAGWLFFPAPAFRVWIWSYLLIPEELFRLWVGGSVSRFGIADRLPILAAACVIYGLAFTSGWILLSFLNVFRRLTRLEIFVFSTAAGLNVWGTFVLALGLAGQLQNRGLFGALAAGSLGWLVLRRRQVRYAGAGEPLPAAGRASRIWLSIAAMFGMFLLLSAMVPPWYFDVREYHLQVPKEWFQSGRVGFLPHNVYGNMPLGGSIHSVLGMLMLPGRLDWWWGSLAGKAVIAGYAPLTAAALYAAGRRYWTPLSGALAAVIYLSLPWVAHVSSTGMIEGVLACYTLLSVYAMLLLASAAAGGAESAAAGEPPQARGLVTLAGWMAGSAAACKYPSLLFVVAPLALGLGWVLPRRQLLGGLAIYAAAVLAAAGLWYAKNAVLAGNPTYPLLYRVFGGETRDPARDQQWRAAHRVPLDSEGRRYSAGQFFQAVKLLGWRSDWLSPLLWPFAVLGAILYLRPKPLLVGVLLAGTLWTFLAWWLTTHRIDRFFVPAMPLIALLAGAGAAGVGAGRICGAAEVAKQSPGWRVTVSFIIGLGLVYGFLINNSRLVGDTRFLVRLDDLRVDDSHPADPDYYQLHPVHEYLNRELESGYRALLVGEAQVFDLHVPILYNTCFDECLLEGMLKGRSREERLAQFRAGRISHVFVFWHELDRYRSPGNYGYSDFVTRDRVRRELVQQQGLLRPVPLELDPDNGELFEVVGWRDW